MNQVDIFFFIVGIFSIPTVIILLGLWLEERSARKEKQHDVSFYKAHANNWKHHWKQAILKRDAYYAVLKKYGFENEVEP